MRETLPCEVYLVWVIQETLHWRSLFTHVFPGISASYHPPGAQRSGVKKVSAASGTFDPLFFLWALCISSAIYESRRLREEKTLLLEGCFLVSGWGLLAFPRTAKSEGRMKSGLARAWLAMLIFYFLLTRRQICSPL